MSSDEGIKLPRLTSLNPLFDALVLEFARRELDDDKLAETLARWTR